MASTLRALRLQKCKWGIERSFVEPHPKFEVQFNLINQYLATPRLGRKSIMWGAKQVARIRDFPQWLGDINKQKEIDYLDERVAAAWERFHAREAEREEKAAKKASKKTDKDTPVIPSSTTAEDPAEKWKRLLGE